MDTITVRTDDALSSQMDRLIAELSSTLIRVSRERVGAAVEDALRRVGETFEIDCCTLVEDAAPGAPTETAFFWVRPERAPQATS
jgi:hypothetical protein